MDPQITRQVKVYELLPYAHVLRKLESFRANVPKCNFTVALSGSWGWAGKLCVTMHEQDLAKPNTEMTGVALLDGMGYKSSDIVVLTEEQYRDWTGGYFRAIFIDHE